MKTLAQLLALLLTFSASAAQTRLNIEITDSGLSGGKKINTNFIYLFTNRVVEVWYVDGTNTVGTLRMTNNPTAGYVLTSDANGVGTWQMNAGGMVSNAVANLDGSATNLTTRGTNVFYGLVTSTNLSSQFPAPPQALVPCFIPTHDYNAATQSTLSTTHPDVYYNPVGFAGWKYWMAHTPWPGGGREFPNIVQSQDGVTWQVPAGLTNPIVTPAQSAAEGYGQMADVDLVVLTNGTMQLYVMAFSGAAGPFALQRKTTTNGVNWSASTFPLLGTNGTTQLLMISPSIVLEPDNSLTMFYMRQPTNDVRGLAFRTSSNSGDSWSSEINCVFSTNRAGLPDPWHLNVTKVKDTYYMLLQNYDLTDRQWLLTSTNRTNFTAEYQGPVIPPTGELFDSYGTYRSAMVALPGDPLRWDVWYSGLPIDRLLVDPPGAGTNLNAHLIGLLRNVRFPIQPKRGVAGLLCPPGSMRSAPPNDWQAGFALFNRFTLEGPRTFRYINFEVAAAAGNMEVGIGTYDHNTAIYEHLLTSGVITNNVATPRAIDLGKFGLIAGEYAVYLWCDSTNAQFHWGNGNSYSSGQSANLSLALDNVSAAGGYAVPRGAYTVATNTDLFISGLFLSGGE